MGSRPSGYRGKLNSELPIEMKKKAQERNMSANQTLNLNLVTPEFLLFFEASCVAIGSAV